MKISDFVTRHPTTIHQLIVAAAFATYFIRRDDVVWQFVRDSNSPVHLERILFAIATLLVGVAAVVCTFAGRKSQSCSQSPRSFTREERSHGWGELLYAIGLGSLAPLAGFVILVGCEAMRIFLFVPAIAAGPKTVGLTVRRGIAPEFAKWGMLATMTVFTITLSDRIAEVLAAIVFTFAIAFNLLPTLGFRKSEFR